MNETTAITVTAEIKDRQLSKVVAPEISTHFDITDRSILQGIHGLPMRQEPLPLLEAGILAIITTAFAQLGQVGVSQEKDRDRDVMADLIIASLVNNAEISHLSIQDIQNVFTDGIAGKFDEERVVTLNVNVVNRWLIAYMGRRMEVNAQLKRLQSAKEREQTRTADPAKTDKEFYEYVCAYIAEKKEIPPPGWRFHTYRHLVKIGQDCPHGEKEMFATTCREKIERERTKLLAKNGFQRARDFTQKYENKEEFANYCRAAWAEKWANDLLKKIINCETV